MVMGGVVRTTDSSLMDATLREAHTTLLVRQGANSPVYGQRGKPAYRGHVYMYGHQRDLPLHI